jgi:two-component system chemotaxis response regulator CheB
MPTDIKVIVIGASTGGLNALKQILPALPGDLSAAVFIVLHIGASESILPKVLQKASQMPVMHASDGAPIKAGHVFIAPPDHHLILEDGHMRLTRGAKENHARPAIDPLFRSAAVTQRQNVIGVVMTGNLDDGTVGLQAVKAYGGVAIVQDPDEAEAPSMPLSATRYVETDYCLPLAEIAPTLVSLVRQPSGTPGNDDAFSGKDVIREENRLMLAGQAHDAALDAIGTRTTQTCPDCGGTIWTINDSHPLRFRCHTGHAYTEQSMVQEQHAGTEQALWAAVRALHERHTLLKRLASGARNNGYGEQAEEYESAAKTAADHAEALRQMIVT